MMLNAQTADNSAIQQQINEKFENKMLISRNFHSGDHLKYNSNGILISGGKPGIWTLHAYFEPKKFQVSQKNIIISGKRLFWVYDKHAPKFSKFYSYSGNTKIEIARSSEQNDLSGIMAALMTVFLKNDESLADFVPSYWEKFIQRNFNEKRASTEYLGSPTNTEYSGSPIKYLPPKVQNNPMPHNYTAEALKINLSGFVVLNVIIDEDGNVKVTDIVKPMGAGMDENTVIEIEKYWKFSPVTC